MWLNIICAVVRIVPLRGDTNGRRVSGADEMFGGRGSGYGTRCVGHGDGVVPAFESGARVDWSVRGIRYDEAGCIKRLSFAYEGSHN